MAEISAQIELLEVMAGSDAFNGGVGYIQGTVKRDDTPTDVPLRRRVRLLRDVDGATLREVWSDAITGEFLFTDLKPGQRYTVIVYDYEHAYRPEAEDNILPEVPA